jgi:hypothetical protein
MIPNLPNNKMNMSSTNNHKSKYPIPSRNLTWQWKTTHLVPGLSYVFLTSSDIHRHVKLPDGIFSILIWVLPLNSLMYHCFPNQDCNFGGQSSISDTPQIKCHTLFMIVFLVVCHQILHTNGWYPLGIH